MSVGFGLSLLCFGSWLFFLLSAARHGRKIRTLRDIELVPAQTALPSLTIIIAARNEYEGIQSALPTLLKTDYPNLAFYIVNDRSLDGTGALLDSFAQKDSRVYPIHIDSLPKEWLGKVHALKVASDRARADWLLFTDADIAFEPDCLRTAVLYCEQNGVDHLSLIPEPKLPARAILLQLFNLAFGTAFVQSVAAGDIEDGENNAFAGVGAFNLVRRSKFLQTEGFEWLRMEVLDDVGLGLMMKNNGGKGALLNGEGLISFRWYPGLSAMFQGLEKNTFGGFGRYSYFRSSLIILISFLTIAFPAMYSILLRDDSLFAAVIAVYILLPYFGSYLAGDKIIFRRSLMFMLPVGFLMLNAALARSMWMTFRHNGIRWRDTYYPLEVLRKYQRVKL